MKAKTFIYTLTMTLLCVSCNNVTNDEREDGQSVFDTSTIADIDTMAFLQSEPQDSIEPVATQSEPQTAAKPQPATSSKTKTTKNAGQRNGTIYISTYGANGKVWGHVTMNGDKGRGSIHDDNENTYSITVTRHGNELFGRDQNGREYVFKLH
ncbi:MAG: hypothetical protein J6Y98_00875 [Bacteroidales bacterium]|nr:hypothetical protein [Bacteroidales bacterium]MCR5192728.1 hypothetical protein [Bacteroidales bacterium]